MLDPSTFNHVRLIENPYLTGLGCGVLSGKKLAVAPAFVSLVKSVRTSEELHQFLESLAILKVDPADDDYLSSAEIARVARAMSESSLATE